jgi:hypothetical protein
MGPVYSNFHFEDCLLIQVTASIEVTAWAGLTVVPWNLMNTFSVISL